MRKTRLALLTMLALAAGACADRVTAPEPAATRPTAPAYSTAAGDTTTHTTSSATEETCTCKSPYGGSGNIIVVPCDTPCP